MSNKYHQEEFVLRELFRTYDRNSNGVLTLDELRGMLNRLNLGASDDLLQALMLKMDVNNNGQIEFEEFQRFIVLDRYHKN